MSAHLLAWGIAALTAAGVVVRPFKWPEAVWAVSGASLIVLFGLLPLDAFASAVGKGGDVYLFLIGMMLLSELGRREGLFDWAATLAVNHARTSPKRLFLLVYAVGAVVTVFLSNDATAVVLTPAVFAVARKAQARALPLLLACAFIANAASFVLPMSNPANLVLYGRAMPSLGDWLLRFGWPSLLAIVATYAALRWTQRRALAGTCLGDLPRTRLSPGARLTLIAIGVTAACLLVVSARGLDLGLPTAILGVLTAAIVTLRERASPWPLLKGVSWSVLPLVAGLFVIVEMLDRTGVIRQLAALLDDGVRQSAAGTAAGAGVLVAIAGNLVNNLPAGLVASATLALARPPQVVVDALLIGVDLGPNLSITGSLATILWLTAIRREGADVGFWAFLKVGIVVMPPALLLALGARLLVG